MILELEHKHLFFHFFLHYIEFFLEYNYHNQPFPKFLHLILLLGVIFFGLLIFGGFTWMTARGNQEKTSSALNAIINAVIGIIIVFSAYIATNFVFDNLKLYSSSSPSANGSILAFNDSLKVGPNMFYSVYTLKQSNPKGGLLNLQIVYYNVSDGIIGFKTDQGHLWFLSN